jgi:hypothetical protein
VDGGDVSAGRLAGEGTVELIVFDARKTGSVRDALLVVLEVALARAEAAVAP